MMQSPITAENIEQLAELSRATRGWITELQWSPNGRALAVGGATGVALYSFDSSLTLRGVLEGHGGHVKGMAISNDGTLIASASSDTTIRLWDLKRGGTFTVLEGHMDAVNGVAFSKDDSVLASVSGDKTIRLWDVASGQMRAVLQGHTDEITCAAFYGTVLVSGGWDKTLRLWDIESGISQAVLQHGDWIRDLAVHRSLIASVSKDGSLCLLEAESGELCYQVASHEGGADSVSFSQDGTMMATGGRDNLIKIWNVSDGEQIALIEGHEKPVLSVDFGSTYLASGSGDNTVRVWGIRSNDR
jgi:WD40 repeat protein